MDYELLFPSRFLKSSEFKGRDVTLTIAEVHREKLSIDIDKPEVKGIVSFKETEKQMILNRTNAMCIAAMFGRDIEQWKDKKVTLFPADYKGDTAIRVRGSPELKEPKTVEIKLFKRRPFSMQLKNTAKPAA